MHIAVSHACAAVCRITVEPHQWQTTLPQHVPCIARPQVLAWDKQACTPAVGAGSRRVKLMALLSVVQDVESSDSVLPVTYPQLHNMVEPGGALVTQGNLLTWLA